MPILRSQPQADLLTLLLLHPEAEYSITERSVKLGTPLTTVQREVNRFSQAGLINERRVGRTWVVSANPAGRYTRPLTEPLTVAFGPHVVIREEFADIPVAVILAVVGPSEPEHDWLRPGDEIVVLSWHHLSPRGELSTHPGTT